jgi:hypothetical protein
MKPVLGLPGRNPETEAWMTELLSAAGCKDAEVARYAHWQEGGDPDVAREASGQSLSGRRLVVAKSLGTMVLLAAAKRDHPERAVLIGTPIKAYSEAQIEALKTLAARLPCLFIQQSEDFTGSAASLRAVLGEALAFAEVPGSDHVYADVQALGALVRNWQAALDG